MTGLLVSVRDGDEARCALAGGVDVVDVKEPRHGALGAASPRVWREVRDICGGQVPTSAALGELHEAEAALDEADLTGFDFVKIGLSGCGLQPDWPARWARLLARLPCTVAPVAVIYADWQACQAPPPGAVIRAAAEHACQTILFDTWGKQQGNLLDHLGLPALASWRALSRRHGLRVVLAGSLDTPVIRGVWNLGPDFLAVRGAACEGGRTGRITTRRVAQLVRLLRELGSPT